MLSPVKSQILAVLCFICTSESSTIYFYDMVAPQTSSPPVGKGGGGSSGVQRGGEGKSFPIPPQPCSSQGECWDPEGHNLSQRFSFLAWCWDFSRDNFGKFQSHFISVRLVVLTPFADFFLLFYQLHLIWSSFPECLFHLVLSFQDLNTSSLDLKSCFVSPGGCLRWISIPIYQNPQNTLNKSAAEHPKPSFLLLP